MSALSGRSRGRTTLAMSAAGGMGEAEAKKELECLGVPELKARLKARGLSASGKKAALIMRLLNTEDKGLAPSLKEISKTKAVTKSQTPPAATGKGFGAVAQPTSRVVKRSRADEEKGTPESPAKNAAAAGTPKELQADEIRKEAKQILKQEEAATAEAEALEKQKEEQRVKAEEEEEKKAASAKAVALEAQKAEEARLRAEQEERQKAAERLAEAKRMQEEKKQEEERSQKEEEEAKAKAAGVCVFACGWVCVCARACMCLLGYVGGCVADMFVVSSVCLCVGV